MSNFFGPTLVDIVAAGSSILALYVLLKFWQPKKIWRFEGEQEAPKQRSAHSRAEAWKAWMPWIILSVIVFVWGTPAQDLPQRVAGNPGTELQVPFLHNVVLKAPPVAPRPTPEAAVYVSTGSRPPARRCSSPESPPACSSG